MSVREGAHTKNAFVSPFCQGSRKELPAAAAWVAMCSEQKSNI